MPTATTPTSDNSADYELLPPSEQLERQMGGDERYLKQEGRKGDLLAQYTALTAVAVLSIVTWMIVLRNHPVAVGWFAFHPLLQTLSLAFITYGIMTLQPTSQPSTKAAGLVRHQVAIFLLGFPFIMLGTLAVMYNKWLRNADHFTTWHGTIGITCVFWILVQGLLGGGSVWFRGAAFGGGAKAKAVWKYHRLSGYLLFPMLLFTAHLGGSWSSWGAKYSGPGIRIITYTISPAVVVGAILARVRLSKMKFF